MNNTDLFSRKSGDYSRFRPSYPEAAIDWLFERCGPKHVLDVGAGTGIFTRALLRRFHSIAAVEPNADMRCEFVQALPGITCSGGTGEATGFPDASFDLITAAQAFHWFDAERFKIESERLLRPGGKIAIVWNTSIKNDFTMARDQICRKYCPRFRSGHAGKHSPAEGDAFLRHTFFKEVEFAAFSNPFPMNIDIFEGNIRSRSYALRPEDDGYDDFMAEHRELFNHFAIDGIVVEPQETQIYFGRI